MPQTNSSTSSSLLKGLRILEVLASREQAMTLSEISQHLKINKTSVFRFLNALVQSRYVVVDRHTKRYSLGFKALDLGFHMLSSLDLPRIAEPHLVQLSRSCGEAANLGVLDGTEVVFVGRVAANHPLAANFPIGTRMPVHCTSMGKAMLAHLPWETATHLLALSNLNRVTENTLTTLAQLEAEMVRIRAQGYAVNDQEAVRGLRSVAAPILRGFGDVAGAVNVSAPVIRVSIKHLTELFVPMVMQTAREISGRLGYRGSLPVGAESTSPGQSPPSTERGLRQM